MRTDTDALGDCACDGIGCLGMGMATIETQQSCIIHRLDAIFDEEEGVAIQFGKVAEKIGRHAVGTRTNDKPYHVRHRKGFFVLRFQMRERIIGIRVGLKVGEVFHVGVLASEETLAFFQLLSDGLGGGAIIGIEGLIVAIGTATCTNLAIAVRTCKTSMKGNLLCFHAELGSEPCAVVIVKSHVWKRSRLLGNS